MTVPRLHAVTDDARLADPRFVQVAAAVLAAGGAALALHLRGRHTSAASLHALAAALAPAARAAGAKLLVNDRVDVALTAGADGVQLPEDALDVADARTILGDSALIGVSRHAHSIATRGTAGADFVVWGAVFETASHGGEPAAGMDGLRAAVAASALPVVAIGGVGPERVGAVLAAGAHGVAVLSGIWTPSAGGPADAVRAYCDALEAAAGTDTRAIG